MEKKAFRPAPPDIVEQVKKHLAEGWSFHSFVGGKGIGQDSFYRWCKEVPELGRLRDDYKFNKRNEMRVANGNDPIARK